MCCTETCAIPTCCLFTPGLGIPAFHIKVFWTCVTVLSTTTLNRPSLSPWLIGYKVNAFTCTWTLELCNQRHFPWTGMFGPNRQSSSFVSPTKSDVVKLDGVSALLSSVILNFWSSDTPYLLRIYYNLVFGDYWPQMFVAVVFSACELFSFFLNEFQRKFSRCVGICVLESLHECILCCRCSHSQNLVVLT